MLLFNIYFNQQHKQQFILLPFYLIYFFIIIVIVKGEQRIVEEPEDTVARIGENVLLKCRVQNQKGHVYWMKGEVGLGHKRDMPFFERMSMVGDIDKGEFHLEIKNVTLADDDNYRCQLTPTDDEPQPKLSRRAILTIIVEPKPPILVGELISGGLKLNNKISQFNQIAATEGYSLQISCQSRNGRPPAKINWVLAEDWQAKRILAYIVNVNNETETNSNLKHLIAGSRVPFPSASGHPLRHSSKRRLFANISEFNDLDGDSQLYTVISHLNFSPSREDNGNFLVCMAEHEAYGNLPKTTSISLDVFYPPKVIIEIEPEENSMIKETGSIRLLCRSDSRPNEDLKYSWSWEGEGKRLEILGNHRVSISSLRFNDNLKKINCTVENSVGFGSSLFTLNIPFGPRFMSTNQTKIIDRGSETNFQCEVLGNPQPIVKWYHGREQETPIHEGINFTIKNAQDWEEGEYRCIAQVDGFPSKTLYHQLYLKGPPKIKFLEYSIIDTTITLTCEIQSRVLPINIQWFHNGYRMDILEENKENNKKNRFQVFDEKIGKYELLSKMTILDFIEDDLGLWNCSARNDFGIVWEQKEIKLFGILDKIETQWKEMPFKLRIVLGSAFFCIFAILFLLLLIWLLWRGCCCCYRRNGHSKMSNHSSCPNGGSISVKCEPVDGMTASESCGTPPYQLPPQQYFYNNEGGGLTAEQYSNGNNINNNNINELINQQQIIYEYEQNQNNGNNCGYYFEDNLVNNLFEQQQHIINNNNGRRSSASTFNNNIISNGNINGCGGSAVVAYCPSLQLNSYEYQHQQQPSNGIINQNNNNYLNNNICLPRLQYNNQQHQQQTSSSPTQQQQIQKQQKYNNYCNKHSTLSTTYFSSPLNENNINNNNNCSPPLLQKSCLNNDDVTPLINSIGINSNNNLNLLERSLSRNSTHV